MSEVLKPQSASQDNVICTKKKLLHFGVDWIRFNIAPKDDENPPPSIKFLDSLYRIPHNDTNASEFEDFIWADTDIEVSLQFNGKKQKGEELFIRGERGKSLLRILRINKKGSNKIGSHYSYRIDCYGSLFDYERIGLINVQSLLAIFISDIETGLVRHSVSRNDICADISGYKVKSIKRGIIGDKKHKKKKNVFNEDDPESFYYGKKKDKWLARVYNKLLDIQVKRKEWIFLKLDYFKHQLVTRIETEAHSDICLEKSLTLPLCFNNEYLFGIYKSLLHTKFVEFTVLPFIEKELKKRGFQIITPVKREHNPETLSKFEYIKQLFSRIDTAVERYDITPEELFGLYHSKSKPETGMSLNQNEVATIEDFRTIFSCK